MTEWVLILGSSTGHGGATAERLAKDGYGYLEDRRPSANMDPYKVCSILIETTCG